MTGNNTQLEEDRVDAPFLTTTTYEVWMRLEGQDWRLWSGGFVEEHHAKDDAANLAKNGVRAGLVPRKVRVARRTVVVDWTAFYV